MISFGHFQMRLDYLLDSGMHGRCSISNPCSFDCLSSAIVSISSGSSINKVDKENKDTGHIKDTGIGMTQEGLMKTCKQSSSAALQSFWASSRTLHLLVR